MSAGEAGRALSSSPGAAGDSCPTLAHTSLSPAFSASPHSQHCQNPSPKPQPQQASGGVSHLHPSTQALHSARNAAHWRPWSPCHAASGLSASSRFSHHSPGQLIDLATLSLQSVLELSCGFTLKIEPIFPWRCVFCPLLWPLLPFMGLTWFLFLFEFTTPVAEGLHSG